MSLSNFEAGRCLSAIEWVSRGDKPLAEVGCVRLELAEVGRLQAALDDLLGRAGETGIRAYILQLADLRMYAYGFYAEPWTIEARLFLEENACPDWLQGLLFGYSPSSIQAFINSSDEPRSNGLPADDVDMEETVLLLRERSRTHSHSTGKSRRLG